MPKPKVKSVVAIVKLYWDKKYGSTYNSVDVLVNGTSVGRLPASYGGESIATDRVVSYLVKEGYLKAEEYKRGGYPALWRLAQETGFTQWVDTIEVKREEDLYHEPKPAKASRTR